MDLLSRLRHDHAPLGEGVVKLRSILESIASKEALVESVATEFASIIDRVRDEMLEHFAEEEETIFPFLREALPQFRADLGRLESGHDQIAGALSRMLDLAKRDAEQLDELIETMEHVFERLESSYYEHARMETSVLDAIAEAISPELRKALNDQAEPRSVG